MIKVFFLNAWSMQMDDYDAKRASDAERVIKKQGGCTINKILLGFTWPFGPGCTCLIN